MPEPRIARNIRLTPSLWAALEVEAARQHRSVNNLLEVIATAAVSLPTGEQK